MVDYYLVSFGRIKPISIESMIKDYAFSIEKWQFT
jgi:hypothetical protein